MRDPLTLKYRPAFFRDVVGQPLTCLILQNMVKSDLIPTGVLFSGTRGCGKTSIARILAKTINCENRVDGEPCGECRVCKSIDGDRCPDVLELDAASQGNVDGVRKLIESSKYSPVEKYKVYIIDEAHGVTSAGFECFLKTIEEPPERCIFILCTTRKNKIPETIRSRLMCFDFKDVMSSGIYERLKYISEEEKIKLENDKVLRLIASSAKGSMRDAISFLDQLRFTGSTVSISSTVKLLGTVKSSVYEDIFDQISKGKIILSIKLMRSYLTRGIECMDVIRGISNVVRDMMLIKAGVNDLVKPEIVAKFKGIVLKVSFSSLEGMLMSCWKAERRIRSSLPKAVVIESLLMAISVYMGILVDEDLDEDQIQEVISG